jgi:hypothetical protein
MFRTHESTGKRNGKASGDSQCFRSLFRSRQAKKFSAFSFHIFQPDLMDLNELETISFFYFTMVFYSKTPNTIPRSHSLPASSKKPIFSLRKEIFFLFNPALFLKLMVKVFTQKNRLD